MSLIIDPNDDNRALVDGELASKASLQFGPVGMDPRDLAHQPKHVVYTRLVITKETRGD